MHMNVDLWLDGLGLEGGEETGKKRGEK